MAIVTLWGLSRRVAEERGKCGRRQWRRREVRCRRARRLTGSGSLAARASTACAAPGTQNEPTSCRTCCGLMASESSQSGQLAWERTAAQRALSLSETSTHESEESREHSHSPQETSGVEEKKGKERRKRRKRGE